MNDTISIVIPYFNKKYEIDLVLRAIANQDFDLGRIEIVLVDDGSPEDIADHVSEYGSRLKISCHQLPHSGNRGANRNFGASKAVGDRILFLDSDMVMENDCLSIYDSECKGERDIVLGTRQMLFEFDRKFINRTVIDTQMEVLRSLPASNDERISHLNHYRSAGRRLTGQWQLVYSHSMMVSKKALQDVGGFDEEFSKNWGAEDVELGYRLYKAGCAITLDERIRSYHLYHPTNHDANIESLKRNYVLFLRKHPDWNVELFTREFETWVVENVRIQERILARHHVLDGRRYPRIKEALGSGNCILTGIEWESEGPYGIPEVFLPGHKQAGGTTDCFGINTQFRDGCFDVAFVSCRYFSISSGLFFKIASEMERISKRLEIVGPADEVQTALSAYARYRGKEVVVFTTAQEIYSNLNRVNYLNLALACDRIGMSVGVQMFYDPCLLHDINSGYLMFSNPSKRERLSALMEHGLNFVGDSIASVMDYAAARRTSRGIGARLLWEDFPFTNMGAEVEVNYLSKYRDVIYRSSADAKRFNAGSQARILCAGFDAALVEKVMAGPRPEGSRGKFVFMWSSLFTSEWSFLDVALEAFSNVYSKDPAYEFKVVVPGNFLRLVGNEYRNASVERMAMNSINHIKTAYDLFLGSLMEKYAGHGNIVFINGVLTEEEYAMHLHDSDTLVDSHGHRSVNPLAVMSLAMGKRTIVPGDGRYSDYEAGGNLLEFETMHSSALYNPGQIDFRYIRDDDNSRYYLVHKPVRTSLEKCMAMAKTDRAGFALSEGYRRQFSAKFDWVAVAHRLKSMLREIF